MMVTICWNEPVDRGPQEIPDAERACSYCGRKCYSVGGLPTGDKSACEECSVRLGLVEPDPPA